MRLSLVILLFSTSLFATNVPNQIAVRLDIGATTFTLLNTGSAAGSEILKFAPTGSQRMDVSASPIDVPPTDATTYTPCNDPCQAFADLSFGQWYYWAEYKDISGNPLSPRRFVTKLTVPQHEIATVTTSPLPMPREVIGQDYYATHVQLSAIAGSGSLRAWFRINHPWYANVNFDPTGCKIQVQINGKIPSTGATGWECINASTATILDEWGYYGAIPYNPVPTVILTMPITSGVMVTGNNVFGMRTTLNDHISSGSRFLEINVIEADKELSACPIASNVVTCTSTGSHGFSSSDEVKIHGAPGPYGRSNGSRTITVTNSTHFTFTPCGTNPNMLNCTSPDTGTALYNAKATVPISHFGGGTWPNDAQAHMYAAKQLIASSAFVWTDWNAFTSPGGDATNGEILWNSQTLAVPDPKLNYRTTAACSNCHWVGGGDLYKFAFSNYSIKQRSIFHGLTASQGDDIAAFIRGNTGVKPTMGTPWNPPYQPGQTIDSLHWTQWIGGAGIDSVLMYGNDWVECMAPAGDYTNWRYTGNLPIKACPEMVQLFDWNHWLPQIYPQDGFPALTFSSYGIFTGYTGFKGHLSTGRQTGSITSASGQTISMSSGSFACTNGDVILLIDPTNGDEAVTISSGCNSASLVTGTRGYGDYNAAAHTNAYVSSYTGYKNAPSGSPQYGDWPGPGETTHGSGLYTRAVNELVGVAQANGSIGERLWPAFLKPSNYIPAYYAIDQWMLSKLWEMQQENFIEGMTNLFSNDLYGPCTACPGGQYLFKGTASTKLFETAFHRYMANARYNTYSPSGDYGGEPAFGCQSNNWYRLQDINYGGNGNQSGGNPVDVGYDVSFRMFDCSRYGRPAGPESMILNTYTVQQSNQNGAAPNTSCYGGGCPPVLAMAFNANGGFFNFTLYRWAFAFNTDAEMTEIMTQWAENYKALVSSVSTATWLGWVAEPNVFPWQLQPFLQVLDVTYPARYTWEGGQAGNYPGSNAMVLPMLGYFGVSSTLINWIRDFSATVWPSVDWQAQVDGVCTWEQRGGGGPWSLGCTNWDPSHAPGQ